MDIQEFISKREFLYHLTDIRNLPLILRDHQLRSTISIVEDSGMLQNEITSFIRSRRATHGQILINEETFYIRDQRPISTTNLQKCLTPGYDVGDFIKLLNSRVFFWPTIQRLDTHYQRYKNENPVIIKVRTNELFEINDNPEFCRLNSGATRSNSYLGGAPPMRGDGTFLGADLYQRNVSSVAEVTFLHSCHLPQIIFTGPSPNGPWEQSES